MIEMEVLHLPGLPYLDMCSDKSGSYSTSNSIIIIKLPVFDVDDPNFSTSPLNDNPWLAKLLTTEQTLVRTLIQYFFSVSI